MTGTDQRLNRKLLLEYDQKRKLYDDFLVMILRFLGEFIKENDLGVFSFEGSVMSHETLQSKLKNGLVASSIEEIDDFVEVEILTFFEDDVHAVSHVLDTEFKMIEGVVDRAAVQDPKRFGYLSPTYIVRMMDSRLEWIEYRCFKECKVKVKVSSLLQHTWGRIQNRLAIDKNSIPYHQLRPTERIVGLFELADRELNQLKKTLPLAEARKPDEVTKFTPPPGDDDSEQEPLTVDRKIIKPDGPAISLRKKLTAKAEAEPELVLTPERVGKLILDDPVVRRVDRLISDAFSTRLKFDTVFIERLCEESGAFHIPSNDSLLKFINQHEKMIFWQAEDLIKKPLDDTPFTIPRGVSILMVLHAVAKDGEDREAIDKITTIVHHSVNNKST
ncbi:MAG: hypothetical protein HQL70_03540 [Magnetococcales bacterium]|nr:hypothetical protein [Magnetococcales bacterium]